MQTFILNTISDYPFNSSADKGLFVSPLLWLWDEQGLYMKHMDL